jgi:hypothetical protein
MSRIVCQDEASGDRVRDRKRKARVWVALRRVSGRDVRDRLLMLERIVEQMEAMTACGEHA